MPQHLVEPPAQEEREVPAHGEAHDHGLAQALAHDAPPAQRLLEPRLDVEQVGKLGHGRTIAEAANKSSVPQLSAASLYVGCEGEAIRE